MNARLPGSFKDEAKDDVPKEDAAQSKSSSGSMCEPETAVRFPAPTSPSKTTSSGGDSDSHGQEAKSSFAAAARAAQHTAGKKHILDSESEEDYIFNGGDQDGSRLTSPPGKPQQGISSIASIDSSSKDSSQIQCSHDNKELISHPHAHDVLMGRGKRVSDHAGNEFFREHIRDKRTKYETSWKFQKGQLAHDVVDQVRGQDPPGRFLEMHDDRIHWVEVAESKALEKASQALREKKWDRETASDRRQAKAEAQGRVAAGISTEEEEVDKAIAVKESKRDHMAAEAAIVNPNLDISAADMKSRVRSGTKISIFNEDDQLYHMGQIMKRSGDRILVTYEGGETGRFNLARDKIRIDSRKNASRADHGNDASISAGSSLETGRTADAPAHVQSCASVAESSVPPPGSERHKVATSLENDKPIEDPASHIDDKPEQLPEAATPSVGGTNDDEDGTKNAFL